MDGHMLVEVVFMMVILKIPVVYLCAVVWWAVRAEPRPPEPALRVVDVLEPVPGGCRWRASRPRPLPRGGRGYAPRRAARPVAR